MSRLFKKIQNAPIKNNDNLYQDVYSNINKVQHKKHLNYGLIVCVILFTFGGILSYLIIDNIDCFYETVATKDIDNRSDIKNNHKSEIALEQPVDNLEKAPVVTKSEEVSSADKTEAISLSQCLTKWANENLENPIFQKENITQVVNELSGVALNVDGAMEEEIGDTEIMHQREHLRCINDFLKRFQIECVRIDGQKSRVQANGRSYMINTIVSQYPRLRLSKITNGEIIFTDENNQEYRKEISQYE